MAPVVSVGARHGEASSERRMTAGWARASRRRAWRCFGVSVTAHGCPNRAISLFLRGGSGHTPSVPNYKSFQKIWKVKPSQSLTKIIERNTKIYDIKYVYYENIANKKSNDN